MASKLSNTEVSETNVSGIEKSAPQAGSLNTKGGKAVARAKRKPAGRNEAADVAPHEKSACKSATPKATKADLILKKLRTAKGASIEMLIADTGWQAHSVRGFLSAVVKKKLALDLTSAIGKDGMRRYRIDVDVKSV